MTLTTDDLVPVTGGYCLADDHVRDDVGVLRDVIVGSDLDRQIVRLLSLHCNLRVQFRNQDLSRLSDLDKRALLLDMNDLLGIRPLNFPGR